MAIIYCIWDKNGSSGYYGQDINTQPETNEWIRIHAHITHLFDGKKDGVVNLIKKFGFGGLNYGYWDASDYFGLNEKIWNDFQSYYNIQGDEALNMHLAELCFITANRGRLAETNVAMGGGGLTLNFNEWAPVKNLLNSHWKQSLTWEGQEINIDKTFKFGIVQVHDITDLMPDDKTQEIIALNKVLYAKKYCLLRILTRIAPYYALHVKEGDDDNNGNVTTWITNHFLDLIKNREQAKKDIASAFVAKFQKVCNNLDNFINNELKQVNENFTIDLWKVFSAAKANKFIQEMAEYVGTHIASAISNSMIASLAKNKRNAKRIKAAIEKAFFVNRNDKKSNKASQTFTLTFRLSRDVILQAARNNNPYPQWYLDALSICKDKYPIKKIGHADMIQEANFCFRKVFAEVHEPNLVPKIWTGEGYTELPGTIHPTKLSEEQFLMNRMRDYYYNLGFFSNSTTMSNWEEGYRQLMSCQSPGFEEVSQPVMTQKYWIATPEGRLYQWNSLWFLYKYLSNLKLDDLDLTIL